MVKRLITSLLALPVFLFFVLKGDSYLLGFVIFISIIGLSEFYRIFEEIDTKTLKWLGGLTGLAIIIAIFNDFSYLFYLGIIFLFAISLLINNLFSKRDKIIAELITFFGVFYVVFGFSHLLLIDKLEIKFIVLLPFTISWGSDTFAYFVGRTFGKKKLMPSVSPNKTVAGAIGGVIGSGVINYIFAILFIKELVVPIVIISLLGSVLSQIGDLIASKIKRVCNAKDFGKLFPGHGGVLDRFDSTLVTIPYVFYVLVVLKVIK